MKTLLLIAILAGAGQLRNGDDEISPGLGAITLDANIKIRSADDKDIPALEEGVLIELTVRDGARVNQGDLIAKIDDSEAQAALEIADIKFEGAKKRAADDIEARYAEKQAAVTKTDWEQDLLANEQKTDAVPAITIRRKKLDYERSVLQIEKAKNDSVLALYDAKSALAEKKAAQLAIDRRVLHAPFDGVVETVYQHQHEWVNPGDPIVRLMRLDTMHVECFVSNLEYDPIDVAGKPVTVTIDLARGRQEVLQGRVVYYSQTPVDEEYRVLAEVENRREGEHWLVRPGLPATITIHVSEPVVAAKQ